MAADGIGGFGARLRWILKREGIRPVDLVALLGKDKAEVSRWCNSAEPPVKLQTSLDITTALRCQQDTPWLVFGVGSPSTGACRWDANGVRSEVDAGSMQRARLAMANRLRRDACEALERALSASILNDVKRFRALAESLRRSADHFEAGGDTQVALGHRDQPGAILSNTAGPLSTPIWGRVYRIAADNPDKVTTFESPDDERWFFERQRSDLFKILKLDRGAWRAEYVGADAGGDDVADDAVARYRAELNRRKKAAS